MNEKEYDWIKARHELAGEVMVRPINKDESEFVSQDGYIYLIKDLDFSKIEQFSQ